jgi:GTP-binding protein Era
MDNFKTGFVAIIGHPNVGKSTIVNVFLGQKVASVTHKAQTTRKRQLGILTTEEYQIVFLDTPGIHTPHHKLGEFLNQEAERAMKDVDLILWVVDAEVGPTSEDSTVALMLGSLKKCPPVYLVLNKMDKVAEEKIEERVNLFTPLFPSATLFQISALNKTGMEELLAATVSRIPFGQAEYDADVITDFYERDIAAELIREACLIHLRSEVPHGVNIRIDEFTERGEIGALIHATIFVERESQKGIIIGDGGTMLKRIGITARKEIESMSNRKVFLELRVKLEKDWRDDEMLLTRFGYKIEHKKKPARK